MDAVLRGSAVYLFLVVVFSVIGRRTLVQTTNFDLLLVIIIGQCTQLALLGDDFSVSNAMILVATLVTLHLAFARIKAWVPNADRWIGGGLPIVVAYEGRFLDRRARRVEVGEDDVMLAARQSHGLERMDEVRFAVVERTGDISIVPRSAPEPPQP